MDETLSLDIGSLFVEQGQLFAVTGVNKAHCIDSNNGQFLHDVQIGGCEYKLIGAIKIDVPPVFQHSYWIALSSYFKFKYENKIKVNNNMLEDIIKNVNMSLWDVLAPKNAGMKRNVYIGSIGNTTFSKIKKKLSDKKIVSVDWKKNKISTISGILTREELQALMGKKYPLQVGQELITLDGVRLIWVKQKKHIRDRHFRVECHIVSSNKLTGRVIGGLNEKQIKTKAKKIKKRIEKNRKVFGKKPGQVFETPWKYNSSRIFYETLFAEDKSSIMAISYLLIYGCFSDEEAEYLYKTYHNSLWPPHTFDFSN